MKLSIVDLLIRSLEEKIEEGSARDIGKILQFANEIYVREYLTSIGMNVSKCEEDEMGNEPSWDIESDTGLRIQAKFRGGVSASGRPKLHTENTRRLSKKNQGAGGKSGHVAYSVDEFDVIVFTIPGDYNTLDTENWEVLAIPASELEDPNNPGYIGKNVSAPVMDSYRGRAEEVLLGL